VLNSVSLRRFGNNPFISLDVCIAHPYCARFSRHWRVHVQNERNFPQTKLDGEINSFLFNEHGDPQFFFHVFAKNIFEEEKTLIVEHDFFRKIGPS